MWITEFRENKRECFAVLAEMAISSGFSYQHVGGTEIVLAGHALFQLLRHLLDILNFIQQVQDMLMFNSFNPQFAKLIPFAVQQHLAWKQIFFDLQLKDWVSPKSYQSKPISVVFFFVTISINSLLTHSLTYSPWPLCLKIFNSVSDTESLGYISTSQCLYFLSCKMRKLLPTYLWMHLEKKTT